MKKYFYATLFISVFSVSVRATEIADHCYSNAEIFTEKFAETKNYDAKGFKAFQCIIASNGRVVICDVSAYKGNGEGVDTYKTVMNLSCTEPLRVEVTGEE
jgi:hypothetical protein